MRVGTQLSVTEFIERREADWQRLEQLIARNQGRNVLTAQEIHELGMLYRAVTSDLAVARRDFPRERVTAFLNQLLTKSHSFIYQEDVTDSRNLFHYFTHTIPQTFRETWVFTVVGFLLFLVPFIVGFRLAYINPAVAEPLGLEGPRAILADQQIWTEIPPNERPAAMSTIATNNIRVAILAFGGGITLGIFSVYILTYNGLVIGAVLGLAYHYGLGYELTNFVFAHGVVELSVIFMAGGAGLQVGWAVINPGIHLRRDSIAKTARRAAALVTVSILLLLGSGAIEGFLSPSDAAFWIKVATGLGTGALMYSYLILSGWERKPEAM
ncbi:MAG: stage II sporulation protein M [Chloroflexota bacterium]